MIAEKISYFNQFVIQRKKTYNKLVRLFLEMSGKYENRGTEVVKYLASTKVNEDLTYWMHHYILKNSIDFDEYVTEYANGYSYDHVIINKNNYIVLWVNQNNSVEYFLVVSEKEGRYSLEVVLSGKDNSNRKKEFIDFFSFEKFPKFKIKEHILSEVEDAKKYFKVEAKHSNQVTLNDLNDISENMLVSLLNKEIKLKRESIGVK